MSQQHSHTTTPFNQKNCPIQIVCDGLQSPSNIGALFRIADAFGVENIVFGGYEVPINSNRLHRTSRNTHKNVAYSEVEQLEPVIAQLKQEGYLLVALEITKDSMALQEYIPPQNKNIALVIGNEKRGISESVLAAIETQVHIEMYGANSSMNVVQAVAIALYALTKHL